MPRKFTPKPKPQKSRRIWQQPAVGHGKVVVLLPGTADAYKTTEADYKKWTYPAGTQVWIDGIEVAPRFKPSKDVVITK